MASSQFKDIYTAPQLERAVTELLKLWFPTYLREMERQLDIQPDSVKEPVTYTTRNVFDALPGEELPKCVVVSPGLSGPPKMRGGGSFDADWRIGVGVAMASTTETEAKYLVGAYAGALRGIMLQQLSNKLIWLGEDYDDIQIPNKSQLYKAAACYFSVEVPNVATRFSGPLVPDLSPDQYGYGEVQSVVITKKLGV